MKEIMFLKDWKPYKKDDIEMTDNGEAHRLVGDGIATYFSPGAGIMEE